MDILLRTLTAQGANALLIAFVIVVVTAFATNRIYLSREMERERQARDEVRKDFEMTLNTQKQQQELFDQALKMIHNDLLPMLIKMAKAGSGE